jgi:hypothetical protein
MRLHDQIRGIAEHDFVDRSRSAGRQEFAIGVRDLMANARAAGLSTSGRTPAFCKAIQTTNFLDDNGLELLRVDGPQSKLSTTVVVHYRFRNPHEVGAGASDPRSRLNLPEDPLLGLSGVLRGAIREGAAAFVRELRRDKDSRIEVNGARDRSDSGEESAA